MIIGVPKEIKTREYRVGMTPAGVRSLTSRGHKVLVERGAGEGSGIKDAEYVAQGATIVPGAADAVGEHAGDPAAECRDHQCAGRQQPGLCVADVPDRD